ADKPADWDPEAMIPFGPKPVPQDRWFESKPLVARLFIMVAGVTMNFVLAILIVAGLAMHAGRTIVPTTVAGDLSAVAGFNGVHVGDTVRAVDGHDVVSWNEVVQRVATGHGAISVSTNRGTVAVPAATDSDRVVAAQSLMAGYYVPAVIDSVVTGD